MRTADILVRLDRRRVRLGLSKARTANLAGLSIATVNRLLSLRENRPSIDSVSALAGVLGLEVVLGHRPRVREVVSASAFRERQARAKARRLIGMVQGSMALEAEGVSAEVRREMEQETVHELLAGPARRLWSE